MVADPDEDGSVTFNYRVKFSARSVSCGMVAEVERRLAGLLLDIQISGLPVENDMSMRLAFLLTLVCVGAPPVFADTLRCGSKIVDTGMTMADVKKYCGQPSSTSVEEQDVRSGNRVVGTTQFHIWRYNRMSGQSTAVLEFDQDKLMSIKYETK